MIDKETICNDSFSQERVVNIVREGVTNVEAAAHSAADTINENLDILKDKAGKFILRILIKCL